ncbi:hypothetical protein A1F94_003880 [Pyrenophora tritici-repentis]|uniref:Uncharacterized protein n=2 Tax=Pyrenophora tritici-repentis TaxID=45151 RepID=B2WN89_PYRTR|nr:uncharacterized protein PTRG_11346 [Pyrenophora tritici-repentis Pt-1C-BFP]XP_001942102.1 uncharacterized protein PTRG_11771 [Pyrenophora tritici-repentis Pt-1C-BFP]KAA8619404.1 hypothetical protein PtrV1_08833 [Pyrenophora tritici-repentis]EDU44396.1 hypothetical protein PTRG_11346 [Pyrenophora tritici-repentis Pt-1C-BFP]EDU44821.1 hypothetical protein PTRG_11771 [Pyrenophora tritici-repentis Pt-1C-BFP]KAA8619410.1 hypothetical protein PtrV1_08839 [Pyrenophora tritici-repentis]KAA8620607.
MKVPTLAILAVAPAMVNACAGYRYCRCGNIDDTKTVSVCQNWFSGKTSVETFEDGHKYCKIDGFFTTGLNNCDFKLACSNGFDSDCWVNIGH